MSTTAPIPAPPMSASDRSTAGLGDFSDRLPPMLVKELRQGLRARTFVGVFLGLQLFLALVMLFATTASGLDGAGEAVSRIIFFFFSLAVLVVQPLRAINSLYSEIKTTTIDMMVLTRLNARRIVAGKWAAIVGQTMLLFVSIVPYLILRYFFGGMNLFAELMALASLGILSACLTAFNVGISGNAAIIVRGIFPLAIAVGMFIFMGYMMGEFDEFLTFFALETPEVVAVYGGLLIGLIYIAWIAFSLGVSAIAPISENHSTINRLITLLTMGLVGLILWLADADKEMVPFLMFMIAAPGIILALSESNFLMPRITIPFIKRGFFGRFFGAFFYPCWTSGVHFAALLLILVLGIGGLIASTSTSVGFDEEEFTVLCSMFGSLLFPALFLARFQHRIANRIGIYIAILIGSYAISLALMAVAGSTNAESSLWLFCWLPPVHFFMVGSNKFDDSTVLVISLIFTAFYLGILLIHAWKHFKTIRDAEESAISSYFSTEPDAKS